ncbi:MAG: glycosyltransferase [Acidimicrobiales bacterium]
MGGGAMRRVAMLSLHTSPLAQPGTGDSGGMNVYVRELSSALAEAGIETRVYVRRWSDDLDPVVEVEPGFRVVHVPAGPTGLAKEDLPAQVDAFTAGVRADLDRFEPDVIHANYWLSGVAGRQLKDQLGLPLVSTFHTLARVKAEVGEPEPDIRVRAEAAIMAGSDVVVANCTAEADELVNHYGVPRDRIEIVPPGVDHALFSPGSQAGARWALQTDDRPLLLFVGRIQPLKGVDVAVEALAALRHRDARLWIVGGASGTGGGREVERVEKLIARHGLGGRVHFVAPRPHHLLGSYYRAADVCLVPSRSESFGLVALEAAACGVPTVASAVGGLTTLVDHGHTGYLVDGRDPVDYAAWVDTILGDPVLARRLSISAAARGRTYTWSAAAARLRRIYRDLTAPTIPTPTAAPSPAMVPTLRPGAAPAPVGDPDAPDHLPERSLP